MTLFVEPYHAKIINTANSLDRAGEYYLPLLTAFATFAAGCKTPKEYRAEVAAAFKRHAELLENEFVSGAAIDVDDAIEACNSVDEAMKEQDEADATKEQQAQQQQ